MGPLRAVAGSFLFVLFLGFGAAVPSAAQPGDHAVHRQPPPVVVTGAPTPAPEATSPNGAEPSASTIATLPVEVGPGGGDYQPELRTDPNVEAPFGPGSAGTSPPPDPPFPPPTIPNGTEGVGGGQGALPASPPTTASANTANLLATATATTNAGATPSPKSAASTPAGLSSSSNPSSACAGEAECAGRSPAAKPGPQPERAASVGTMAAVVGSVVVALGMAAAVWRRQTWRRRAQRDTDTDTGLARQVAQDASAT